MRLIDADNLKEAVKTNLTSGEYYPFHFIKLIDNAPTVEYTFEEAFQKTVCENRLYCPARPQGKWITKGYEPFGRCNICDGICEINNFCGHCGADMRGNQE